MKLPLIWLKKYVDSGLSAQALADRLTLTGTKVECVETVLGEPVIDIEVTTNRPDCLSILGLAREVSAITGKSVSIPKIYSAKEASRGAINRAPTSVSVKIEDKKACPYYTARLIENIRVASAPAEASKFLELMGTRPISNIVDVTNFVLFESGQPLHAFDADKIEGGKIVVRRARAGETIVGIDGVTYKLDPETLVIADGSRPVAIAGVIGGKATEVTSSTQRVILESAWFDPALVRRAAKKFKISTESSYRFERRANIEGVRPASDRALSLISEWAGGVPAGPLVESARLPRVSGDVALRLSRLEAVLGVTVPVKKVLAIFKNLGLSARASGSGKVRVAKTAYRDDLQIEADLIEEVLRIEGFEKIPVTLPVTRHAAQPNEISKPRQVRSLRHHLCSAGLREVLTYSLVSSRVLEQSSWPRETAARIANFDSAEKEFMRPALLPGMLGALSFNVNRKATALKLFEIGKRYSPKALGAPDCFEETALCLAWAGPAEENWKRKSDGTVFDVMGTLLDAVRFLGGAVELKPSDAYPWFSSGCDVLESGVRVGFACIVSENVRKNWDLPQPVYIAEISIETLLAARPATPKMAALPKFPSVRRDLAFILDRKITVRQLEETLLQSGAPYLSDVRLFDEYAGKNIPAGKRSLAFALSYQKESGTFTDEEIQGIQGRVVEDLKRRWGVEFR